MMNARKRKELQELQEEFDRLLAKSEGSSFWHFISQPSNKIRCPSCTHTDQPTLLIHGFDDGREHFLVECSKCGKLHELAVMGDQATFWIPKEGFESTWLPASLYE